MFCEPVGEQVEHHDRDQRAELDRREVATRGPDRRVVGDPRDRERRRSPRRPRGRRRPGRRAWSWRSAPCCVGLRGGSGRRPPRRSCVWLTSGQYDLGTRLRPVVPVDADQLALRVRAPRTDRRGPAGAKDRAVRRPRPPRRLETRDPREMRDRAARSAAGRPGSSGGVASATRYGPIAVRRSAVRWAPHPSAVPTSASRTRT